jgi:predicted phosphodiesterase
MRIAIISDIHANFEALEAVFTDIDTQNIDEVICLGDVVGYGANPNECLALVNKRCPTILLGNHDAAAVGMLSAQYFNIHAKIAIEWTSEHLDEGARQSIEKLPLTKTTDDLTFVHATPYEPKMWYYLTSLEEAAFNFQFFGTTLCFVGHTHIPMIIVLNDKKEVYVHQGDRIDYGVMGNTRFLVNVGSVGQPRDRNPKSCYGIVDTDTKEFWYQRIDYDIEKAQAKMKKIKMPEFLITRLVEGR